MNAETVKYCNTVREYETEYENNNRSMTCAPLHVSPIMRPRESFRRFYSTNIAIVCYLGG